MANEGTRKHYKIKYQNLALLLAVFLLIILLISRGCSAIFNRSKNKDDKPVDPLSTADIQQNDTPPESELTTDPTLQTSYHFDSVTKTADDLGMGDLVLVNNKIKFLGAVNESDLVVVREEKNKEAYSVKDYTVMVQPQVMAALDKMLVDFYKATGNDGIVVRAGHRSIEYQQELYDEELEETGQDSSSLVAMPGYSEHHTGLAVDFTTQQNGAYKDFDGTGDYEWIMNNCYKYGFVNRYPVGKESLTMIDNEPWHFRYVGVAHATAMHNLDLCLEEYIDYIKNFTISSGFYSVTTDDGSQYIIYFTPMSAGETTNVYLPMKNYDTKEMYPYEISGNNVDGWIVTFLYQEGTGIVTPQPATNPEVTTVSDGVPEETTTAETQ